MIDIHLQLSHVLHEQELAQAWLRNKKAGHILNTRVDDGDDADQAVPALEMRLAILDLGVVDGQKAGDYAQYGERLQCGMNEHSIRVLERAEQWALFGEDHNGLEHEAKEL